MKSTTPITTAEELRKALDRLELTRDQFVAVLARDGIYVTGQAVWKWTTGRTNRVPGYVGFFLKQRYRITKETLKTE